MDLNNYVLCSDISQLSEREYESFRRYVKLKGHNVNPNYGSLDSVSDLERDSVVLGFRSSVNNEKILQWDMIYSITNEIRLSLEEVRRMAELGDFHEN